MNRGMVVLRSACLTLGLFMALGGSAWAQCQCTEGMPAVTCSTVDFDGALIGNPSVMAIPVLGATPCHTTSLTASISGPNTIEFTVLNPAGQGCTLPLGPGQTCNIMVAFTPLGCGVRQATLTVTFTAAGCNNIQCSVNIPLRGFGCSIDCAINTTQLAIAAGTLTTSGGNSILRELLLAGATTGSVRCFHLNCALCFAQTEAARGRAGAQGVIDQIVCLLKAFCSPAAAGA